MSRTRDAEVRVAIVGCGAIAQAVHVPTLVQLPGVRVVAVIDPSPDALRTVTPLVPRAGGFASLDDAFAAESGDAVADAVLVCAPIPLLSQLAVQAFEARRHVYVEKPLATDAPSALAVHAAWRASGRVGVTGFNYRQHPLLQKAHRLLREGAIGDIVGAQGVFTSRPAVVPAWTQAASAAMVLFDLAPHHVDLLTWLLEEAPTAVAAHVAQRRFPGDTAALSCRFPSGAILQGTYSYDAATDDRLTLIGTTGRLVVDRMAGLDVELTRGPRDRSALRRLRATMGSLTRHAFARTRLLRPNAEPSFRLSLGRFIERVRAWPDAPARPSTSLATIDDGVRCLSVLLAAQTAVASGSWEPVRDLHDRPV